LLDGERKHAIYTHSGILASLYKEGNPIICDSMDEPRGHGKENKPASGRNTARSHLYVISEK
jgi:hypothetical protein